MRWLKQYRGEIILVAAILVILSLGTCVDLRAQTTYHVAPNGGCANGHGVGTTCDSSESTCGAIGNPCCTLQDALDITLSSGDIIELHDATWTYAAAASWADCPSRYPGGASPPSCCGGSACCGNNDVAAYVWQDNITIQAASGDSPVLDLDNAVEGGICIDGDDVTVDGFSVINSYQNSGRVGNISWSGGNGGYGDYPPPNGGTVSNMTFTVTGTSVNSTDAPCIMVRSGSGYIIEDNSCSGELTNGIYLDHFGEGGLTQRQNDLGLIIRDNTITRTTSVGGHQFTPLNIRHGGRAAGTQEETVIYNNIFDGGGDTDDMRAIYARENAAGLYVFNNIFLGVETYGIYFQDNAPSNPEGCDGGVTQPLYNEEDLYMFNNTFVGTGTTTSVVEWPLFVNKVRLNNNIFEDFAAINYGIPHANCSACETAPTCFGYGWPVPTGTGCCTETHAPCTAGSCTHGHEDTVTDTIRSSTGEFTKNVCYNTTCTAPGTYVPSGFATTVTGDPNLDASGKLQVGSSAIGAADNDPLSTGTPGLCSIAISGLETIDCSLDIDGTDRGTTWDIGADEFAAAAGGSRRVIVVD